MTRKSGSRPSKRPANRPSDRSFELIYGVHAAAAALANPARTVLSVTATRNMAARLAEPIATAGLEPDIADPRAIDKLAGEGAVHQGICLNAAPLEQPDIADLPDLFDQPGRPVVLLDQVTDPHNVGAIMRSCAAFGAGALITTARHSPQGSAVLTKAASGAAEHVPLIKVTNLARAIEELKETGFAVIGLEGTAPITIEQTTLPGPYALILGAEDKGLRRLTREHCDDLARLDLPGPLQSLNVSNAAALALYALSKF
jgi:23S rRNA (guanosine2251-2'-O)-methyltransferase